MWVVEKAHIEHQISLAREPHPERERRDENRQRSLHFDPEMPLQNTLQISSPEVRGIKRDICVLAQRQ